MIVYLLRHGIAEDSAPGGDSARALTREGVERLERASAGWCRVVERIDRIHASPLRRAQQTAAILQKTVAQSAPIETQPDLTPSARVLRAMELIQSEAMADRAGIALVGHEPHLGNLLGLLLVGEERATIPFKKGMLVAVELESRASMLGRLIAALSQKLAAR